MADKTTYQDVISFWFEELTKKQHFVKDTALDETIRKRFLALHSRVVAGETAHWRDEPLGRLAEIIVLDQFSRNMFRDTPQSFAFDALALALTQETIRAGADLGINENKRMFVYMPFMHSESLLVHERAEPYFMGPDGLEPYEKVHRDIIARFGRYPHRNEILGRQSTDEELEFLKEHSGF